MITLIACGKLPVMSRLDRYLEVTRIQVSRKNLVSSKYYTPCCWKLRSLRVKKWGVNFANGRREFRFLTGKDPYRAPFSVAINSEKNLYRTHYSFA